MARCSTTSLSSALRRVLSAAILGPASMGRLCQGGSVGRLSLLPGGLAGFPSRCYIGIVGRPSLCVSGTVGRLRLHSGGSAVRLSLFHGGSVGRPSLCHGGSVSGHWNLRCVLWPGVCRACRHISVRLYERT